MKSNRQIGLDGRVFITDCLSDGIFFVYSIILSGFLGAAGDMMKLLGQSSRGMDALTNALVILDLACSLSMVIVTYYVYFMHCGENIPKLGTKPLIYLEYLRLAYYGMLAYVVLYRFANDLQSGSGVPAAIPVFYFFYFAWLICCMCAAMFILTVLHQNVIRRSYAQSFKTLSLVGLGVNIILPLVYFITRIWVRGWGDGFYSAGLCDFVRFALAPIFYAAIWFLFMNAIDQVDRVFAEVDNAIRDRRYRIEFDEDGNEPDSKQPPAQKKSVGKKKGSDKKKAEKPKKSKSKSKPKTEEPKTEEIKVELPSEDLPDVIPEENPPKEVNIDDIILSDINFDELIKAADAPSEPEEPAGTELPDEPDEDVAADEEDAVRGAKRVKPKKKHRITEVEEESTKVKASVKSAEELAAEISEAEDESDSESE